MIIKIITIIIIIMNNNNDNNSNIDNKNNNNNNGNRKHPKLSQNFCISISMYSLRSFRFNKGLYFSHEVNWPSSHYYSDIGLKID